MDSSSLERLQYLLDPFFNWERYYAPNQQDIANAYDMLDQIQEDQGQLIYVPNIDQIANEIAADNLQRDITNYIKLLEKLPPDLARIIISINRRQ